MSHGADYEGWPISWRLLLPLAGLAVLFCGALTWLSIRIIAVRMDEAQTARLHELADTLVAGGYSLNPELLARVHQVTSAEVVTVSSGGEVIVSTLDAEGAAELAAGAIGTSQSSELFVGGVRHRLARRPFQGATLVVAESTARIDTLKRRLAWTIAAASGVGLVLLVVLGRWVVRSTTRPLARLADAAREVGRGQLALRAPASGGREVRILTGEFNAMLDELIRSREELVRAEKLSVAGSIAGTVAHEIRNPLSAIRLNVQLLARRADAASRSELDELLEEVDRLDLVVTNLLDLTTPARLHPELHDFNAVVEGVLRLTARKLEHLGATVERDFDPDLPRVELDCHKVRQALLNVVLNAVEAMPGGGLLRVRTWGDAGAAFVAVEDSGCGLADAAGEKIFDPFFTTKAEGVGLGLHTVRNVMELHGGSVRLEAGAAGGARCVLEFPATPQRPAEVVAVAERSEE